MFNVRPGITILLVLITTTMCSASFYQPVFSSEHQSINVVMDDNYPPYSFRDNNGKLSGIAVDQWELWQQKTGIKVNLTGMNWEKALTQMQSGQFDVIDTIFLNNNRVKLYDFSEPYAQIDVNIFFNRSISGISGIASLKGFKIGVKRGNINIALLRDKGITDFVEFDSYEDVIQAAKDQKVDIFVMDKPPALYFLYKLGGEREFRMSSPLYSEQFHRAVRKGNAELLKAVQNGFSLITSDEYKAINDRWLDKSIMSQEQAKQLWLALGVLCFSVLALAVWNVMLKTSVKKKTNELTNSLTALQRSESKYKNLLANLNVGVVVYSPAGKPLLYNQTYVEFVGYEDQPGPNSTQANVRFVYENKAGAPSLENLFKTIELNKSALRKVIIGIIREDRRETTWVLVDAFPDFNASGEIEQIVVTLTDVTAIKNAELLQSAMLRISEMAISVAALNDLFQLLREIVFDLIEADNILIAIMDEEDGILHFPFFAGDDRLHPVKCRTIRDMTKEVIRTGRALYIDSGKFTSAGEQSKQHPSISTWLGVPLKCMTSKVFGVIAVINSSDITSYSHTQRNILTMLSNQVAIAIERKQAAERLLYVSLHDALTGLHNRTYFEQELDRLTAGEEFPIALVICDIDGLKIINDTLGHAAGDQLLVAAAAIINRSGRKNDVVSRIGGDEFAMILPQADEQTAEALCEKIREQIREYNRHNDGFTLSLSLGYSVRTSKKGNTEDLFREADNYMYREKLHRSQSIHSEAVQVAMKLLEIRDFVTEGHADRMQEYAEKLARDIGLPEKKMADIRLLAQFHDIGKVGIADSILFKPDALTPEEKKEMQRHPEIGYRIALSSIELRHIADWILKHHECWNGKGYPLGIARDEIPVESRILAIVDSYDAMTSDRPYRRAVSHEAALEELKRCAGTQFDPELVDRFKRISLKEKKQSR